MRWLVLLLVSVLSLIHAFGQDKSSDLGSKTEGHQYFEDPFKQFEKSLIGQWTNESMRIRVNTYNNSDTSFIVDITEENWEMKMNVKPIVTTINANGTYISEFRNSFDSLIYRPEGTWLMDGDSLIMEDHQAKYKYQVFIDQDRAEFRSLLDWDKDGKLDDEYFGVQRKNY